MMTRIALALLLALASTQAALAQTPPSVERLIPGSSMVLNSKTLDVFSAVYAPGLNGQTGNYSVKYTQSTNPHNGTDDFSTLDCGAGNAGPVTYTLPTIASNVFPAGHGVGFVNTSTNLLCTITANVSAISGAPGITSGNPAAAGGPITLFPNGQVWLQSDGAGYKARDFVPGVWFQNVNNNGNPVAALQWTGLSGYPEYDLHCSSLTPVTAKDVTLLQVAYNGTFQSAGYSWLEIGAFVGNTPVVANDSVTPGPSTAFELTSGPDSPSDFSGGAGATIQAHFTFADGSGAGYRRSIISNASYLQNNTEISFQAFGRAPANTTAESITGIQIFNGTTGSNLRTGLCWLKPSL